MKRIKTIKVKTLHQGSIQIQARVSWRLGWRRLIAPIVRYFSPGYSWCGRCGLPWSVVDGHSTKYSSYQGCFPLCEFCWGDMEPAERLPYYEHLIEDWKCTGSKDEQDYENIRKAVIAGG